MRASDGKNEKKQNVQQDLKKEANLQCVFVYDSAVQYLYVTESCTGIDVCPLL